MIRRLFTLCLVAGLLFSVAGCASKQKAVAVDDQIIVDQIKQKVEAPDGPPGPLSIIVDSFKGTVTVEGNVPSEGAKEQVMSIIKGIEGVAEVRSYLQIRSQS